MIISRAPVRISFLGGGTDYPEYFLEHGGAVISTSIDKFSYVSLNRLLGFFDHKIRLSYSKTELVESADEIQHPAVRAVLQYCQVRSHIEINCISDLPARTGLGSSGSFIVALLQALHAYNQRYVSPTQLAYEAIRIEREILKDNVGCQDQYAAAVGGLNLVRFRTCTDIQHEPIVMPRLRKTTFEQNLLLFYSGLQRSAPEVVKEQRQKTTLNIPYLRQMRDLVDEGAKVLQSTTSLSEFGKLLHDGWMLKQSLSSKVSHPLIDEMYAASRKAGALGGKLLGAGGGGFLLVYVEPDHQASVRQALKNFREVPFRFEESGSQIIYHKPTTEGDVHP